MNTLRAGWQPLLAHVEPFLDRYLARLWHLAHTHFLGARSPPLLWWLVPTKWHSSLLLSQGFHCSFFAVILRSQARDYSTCMWWREHSSLSFVVSQTQASENLPSSWVFFLVSASSFSSSSFPPPLESDWRRSGVRRLRNEWGRPTPPPTYPKKGAPKGGKKKIHNMRSKSHLVTLLSHIRPLPWWLP